MSVEAGNAAGLHVSQPSNGFPPSVLPYYQWVWANAAARLAQTVTAAQIGGVGYQIDMAREYKLLALTGGAPHRWGALYDSMLVPTLRNVAAEPGNATVRQYAINVSVPAAGAFTLRTAPASGTKSQQRARTGVNTTALINSPGLYRTGGNGYLPSAGFRMQHTGVLGAVSASMRWLMGVSNPSLPNVGNSLFSTFRNVVGIGRDNSQANVQLYHCDAASAPTLHDLGANFPAGTLEVGYELELYTATGASWGVQVRALDTQQEISFTLTTNIPNPGVASFFQYYSNSNADAAAVSLDVADWTWQQITR